VVSKRKPGLKVLLITYYWPPSGGAGVQRWLKLIKYLKQLNVDPIVLTVDEKYASYIDIDHSLHEDIPKDVLVYKTKSFEPINLYARLVGKDKIPTSGASKSNNKFFQKIVFALRSHLFIPDPRKGWVRYAFAEAKKIIKTHQIDTVITTSPPHSTQLIGLKLKKKLGINWIADFRDPWTDIFYYKLLGHSFLSDAINKRYEKSVVDGADRIITVSKGFKQLLSQKSNKSADKFVVIPNGYDEDDFKEHEEQVKKDEFVITYTGTISEQYKPDQFFKEIKSLQNEFPIKLKMIGRLSKNIHELLDSLDMDYEYIPYVSHREINKYQKQADLLVLFIPQSKGNSGIVPGKVFEYLATLNPILSIGPTEGDTAEIIRECSSGTSCAPKDGDAIRAFITSLIKSSGGLIEPDKRAIEKYSRKAQASKLIEVLT
jgi:glycosyltransferase involved in cell wall biosynthesis